jgi:hypothetical protein
MTIQPKTETEKTLFDLQNIRADYVREAGKSMKILIAG